MARYIFITGGVLDTLKKVDEQQGQSGPQAPRSQ